MKVIVNIIYDGYIIDAHAANVSGKNKRIALITVDVSTAVRRLMARVCRTKGKKK